MSTLTVQAEGIREGTPLITEETGKKTLFSLIKQFLPSADWEIVMMDEVNAKMIEPYEGSHKKIGLIRDKSTGDTYLDEHIELVRGKCILLTLGTPVVQTLVLTINVVKRVLKLITLWDFWAEEIPGTPYNFKAKLEGAGKDLLRIVATPIALVGLQVAAIYGIFDPWNGRKAYGRIENWMYDEWTLAPCFRANPKEDDLKVFGETRPRGF
jgi:hypothetical protein